MARSFRRTPISGHTCARSDKVFKRRSARRLRVAVRGALSSGQVEILPEPRDIASQWESRKDGKGWFGHLPVDRLERLMRK